MLTDEDFTMLDGAIPVMNYLPGDNIDWSTLTLASYRNNQAGLRKPSLEPQRGEQGKHQKALAKIVEQENARNFLVGEL